MIESLARRIRFSLFVTGCLTLVTANAAPAAAQPPYDGIVVFGTSLSDSGNAFAVLHANNTPPEYDVSALLVPNVPYARGGHHLSNGATWVEELARTIGLAGSVRPALLGASPGATNYALGAARARDAGTTFNLPDQVGAFLQDSGGVAPSGALYVIEMGGNDIRDALEAFSQGQDGGAIIQEAVLSIAQSIAALHAAGAREFLVWSSPDVGQTPAVRMLDLAMPGTAAFASLVTQIFNAELDSALAFVSALPGIQMSRLDAFQLLHGIVMNPAAFGLANVTDACITPAVPPFTCQTPDEYLFWDGIHPTKAAHAIVAREAAAVLGLQ